MAGKTRAKGRKMAGPSKKGPGKKGPGKKDKSKKVQNKVAVKKPPAKPAAAPAKVSIAPMLSVRNGADAVEFYKTAFGARELFKMADPAGAVVAQLTVGKADFWVADESPEHLNFSPQSLGGATARMVMVVEDPDTAFARAIAAGASAVWTAEDQPYGWRVGRVVDPFGHHWEIGKPLK